VQSVPHDSGARKTHRENDGGYRRGGPCGRPTLHCHRHAGRARGPPLRMTTCEEKEKKAAREGEFISSAPVKTGEGDHAKRGGGGVCFDASLSLKEFRRGRRPLHRAARGPPSPLRGVTT
jgi:hypothetical protein